MFGMGLLEMLIFIPAALVVPASVFYLGLRWVRSQEEPRGGPTRLGELEARVAHLEESLSDLNAQFERVREAQEFTARLLENRPPADDSRAP